MSVDKEKLYYEIALSHYIELNTWYSGLNDKASKLLTFITIISTGLLLLVKWVLDNVNNLGVYGGWIIFIVAILLICLVIELGLILYAMFAESISKLILSDDDFKKLQNADLISGYKTLTEKYGIANKANNVVVVNKGKSLKNSQIGLTILIAVLAIGISLIFVIKYYAK